MSDDGVKETGSAFFQALVKRAEDFKVTTVFVLVTMCLGAHFLMELIKQIKPLWYKDCIITVVILFLLLAGYKGVKWVVYNELNSKKKSS